MENRPIFRFPHEAFEKLPVRGKNEKGRVIAFWKQMLRLGFYFFDYARNLLFDYNMEASTLKAHELYNGKSGAEILFNKYRFSKTVSELGYLIPESVLIPANSDHEKVERLLKGNFIQVNSFICKPIDGDKGRGIQRFNSLDETITFLTAKKRDYLLQEIKGPGRDWRYIFHRDGDHILQEEDPFLWRIAYQKVRPEVVGDGEQSIEVLLAQTKEIPARSRKRVLKQLSEVTRNKVLTAGKHQVLIKTGNIAQGAYGQLPNQTELQEMDDFMYRFHRELEAKLNMRLATACYDVGVLGEEDLEANFTGSLKERVVFFEVQIPFGFFAYLRNLPHKKNKPYQIFIRFCRSLAYSSRQLHQD